MLAQVTGLRPGEFVHTLEDTHLYLNHIEQAKLQLTRQPRKLPKASLNPEVKDIDKFTMDDIKLVDYKHHPPIQAKLIV